MFTKRTHIACGLLLTAGSLWIAQLAAAQKRPVTLDDIAGPPAGVTDSIRWAPSGDKFAIIDNGKLSIYNLATGRQRSVIAIQELDEAAAKPDRSAVADAADWTNRRVSEKGAQWFADGRHLLVAASGDLFVVNADKGSFDRLTHTPEQERDPKLSPDNKFVSFRRGHDLYAIAVKTKAITRLTNDGSETLRNGEADWVYPEELFLNTAYWWSPDSQSLAYLQFDVSREPVFPQVSLMDTHGVVEPERYPKAGDPNAGVRLGVVPVTGGSTKWMELGSPSDNLLARVVWAPNSHELLAERLNRVQNKLDLMLANAQTGAAKTVLHEEDKYWINVQEQPHFLASDERFLWASERSGHRHFYIYGVDGKQRSQVTSGNWEVDKIAAIDEKNQRVFYTSTEASPIERQLYSAALDGSGAHRISEGAGTHSVSFSPDGEHYMDDFSNVGSPVRSTLRTTDGREVAVYREADRTAIETLDLHPVESVTMNTADGTKLYAHLIKPAGFEGGKKYPAVVLVYGGPDVQNVTDSWAGVNWAQVLAQKGFVVWQLDNRGSKGRGHAFESTIWHNLGAQELADQKDGIGYLVSLGFVDPNRIGMEGWSYGGYMVLYTATHAPGLVRVGIAGGSVSDWRNYDSIYTERYMGLPEENAEGYRKSSPVNAAAQMGDTKLLLLHNIEDDNVHFQNTVQMAGALENAGKQFFMVVYPGKQHGVAGPARKQMLDETTKFFEDNLK